MKAKLLIILKPLIVIRQLVRTKLVKKMLKGTPSSICQPLLILFKRSLNEGIYPKQWKQANVIPLFKEGDRDTLSNYRPISLISCVGKVMERIIYKHLFYHLHANNLIFKIQSGFLKIKTLIKVRRSPFDLSAFVSGIYFSKHKNGNDVDSVDVVVHALTSRLGALSRSTL